MLGEFQASIDVIIENLESCKNIANNSAVDDINMDDLLFDFPELTDLAFGVESNLIMTQMLARKESFDALSGHLRLSTVHSRGRSDYYGNVEAEINAGIEQLQKLVGVLTSLEQYTDR